MEMTEDTLKRIATSIVDLTSRIQALEVFIVEHLGGDPQQLDRLINEIREPRHQEQYQSWCAQVFEQLKSDSEPEL